MQPVDAAAATLPAEPDTDANGSTLVKRASEVPPQELAAAASPGGSPGMSPLHVAATHADLERLERELSLGEGGGPLADAVNLGLGRIVALHYRSSTLYHIH